MTKPAILEALAKAMNGPHLPVHGDSKHTLAELRNVKWQNIGKGDRQNFLNQAAAVLELVGPRELVWAKDSEAKSGGFKYSIYGVRDGFNCACYPFEQTHFRLCENVEYEAAQAAAQAHADAAHWKNTKIGGK